MSDQISQEAIAVVARAIHDAAYEDKTAIERERLWVDCVDARNHRKREACAAIIAFENWRSKNG